MIVSFNIPNDVASRVLDALCVVNGYDEFIRDFNGQPLRPNPQTKAEFAKSVIVKFVIETVKGHEAQLAAKSARESAIADVTENINIT